MQLPELVKIIQDIADNPELGLDTNQFHALYLAIAVMNSLPDNYVYLFNAVLDLRTPAQHP